MPKVLIDNDDLSNSEESGHGYEKNNVINTQIITAVCKRQTDFLLGKYKA